MVLGPGGRTRVGARRRSRVSIPRTVAKGAAADAAAPQRGIGCRHAAGELGDRGLHDPLARRRRRRVHRAEERQWRRAALRAATQPAASRALAGHRRCGRSVLLAGRTVDRILRQRQAEKNLGDGRLRRHAVRRAGRPRRRMGRGRHDRVFAGLGPGCALAACPRLEDGRNR